MYRNFDRAYGSYGDTAIMASTSNNEQSSVYASIDGANPAGRMVIVAINKTNAPLAADFSGTGARTRAEVYNLTRASAVPTRDADLALPGTGAFRYTMPPMSISTLVVKP
jgi:O-glycosyl hydrolase